MSGKSLMTYYAEGALISRELHDMMHQYAADARFEAQISSYEDNLAERMYGSRARRRSTLIIHIHKGNPDD